MSKTVETKIQQEEVLVIVKEFVNSIVASSPISSLLYRDASNGPSSGTEFTGTGYRPSSDD